MTNEEALNGMNVVNASMVKLAYIVQSMRGAWFLAHIFKLFSVVSKMRIGIFAQHS